MKKRYNFEVTIYENNMRYESGKYCIREYFKVHTNNYDYFKKKLHEKDKKDRIHEFNLKDLNTNVTCVYDYRKLF